MWRLPVDCLKKLSLMSSDLPGVDFVDKFCVLVYQPRLSQYISCRILQLRMRKKHEKIKKKINTFVAIVIHEA